MKKVNSNSKVTFGKFKGELLINVPYEYAQWVRFNLGLFGIKFYYEWLSASRFNKHNINSGNGSRMFECKYLEFFVYYIDTPYQFLKNRIKCERLYYLVDINGNYVKDLVTIGDANVKQGAIDIDFTDYVTLSPNGHKSYGRLVVTPFYNHFPYETYQVKK